MLFGSVTYAELWLVVCMVSWDGPDSRGTFGGGGGGGALEAAFPSGLPIDSKARILLMGPRR